MTSRIVANRTIAFCLAGAESPLKYPMTLHNYDELVRTNLRQIFTLLTWQSGESTQTPQFIQIRIRIWPSNVLKSFSNKNVYITLEERVTIGCFLPIEKAVTCQRCLRCYRCRVVRQFRMLGQLLFPSTAPSFPSFIFFEKNDYFSSNWH